MTQQRTSDRSARAGGGWVAPGSVRAVGYLAAAWCVGFAGVSAWQVVAGVMGRPVGGQRDAAYASGLAVMSVLVGVLKLVGAAAAVAAVRVRPGAGGRSHRLVRLLGVALWGAFGLLALYSAGNLVIAVRTGGGLLAPSAAWVAAGGVTTKAGRA